MKKILFAFAILLSAGGASAQASTDLQAESAKQLIQINRQLTIINAELIRLRQDLSAPRLASSTPLCWNESKAYGLGARLDNGLSCMVDATPNSAHWEHPNPPHKGAHN